LALPRLFHHAPAAISSTKSMTGHFAQVAGGIESVIIVKTTKPGITGADDQLRRPGSDQDVRTKTQRYREDCVKTLAFKDKTRQSLFRAL